MTSASTMVETMLKNSVQYVLYIKWQYTWFVMYYCFFLNSPSELTFWISLVYDVRKRKGVAHFTDGFKGLQILFYLKWIVKLMIKI
jgi:hypothetical protein